MGDMVDGLRCIAAHRQRSRLAKIVCTSTTLPPDLDDLLAYLRVSFPSLSPGERMSSSYLRMHMLIVAVLTHGRRARTCAGCA